MRLTQSHLDMLVFKDSAEARWCLAGHDRWLELVGVCSPESRVRVKLPVVPAGCFPVLGGEC